MISSLLGYFVLVTGGFLLLGTVLAIVVIGAIIAGIIKVVQYFTATNVTNTETITRVIHVNHQPPEESFKDHDEPRR